MSPTTTAVLHSRHTQAYWDQRVGRGAGGLGARVALTLVRVFEDVVFLTQSHVHLLQPAGGIVGRSRGVDLPRGCGRLAGDDRLDDAGCAVVEFIG